MEELEKQMIAKLTGLGLDLDKSLTVYDIASNFKFYWLKKTDIFTTKEYQILVKDATTTGKIYKELESIGISNISIKQLNHSKMEDFRRQVKVEAIKAAKFKATSIATAIGPNNWQSFVY